MLVQVNDRLRSRLRLNSVGVKEALEDFCRRHHLLSLAVFGSVLREEFRETGDNPSDIDVLVEIDPDHYPAWEYYTWGDELSRIWERKTEVFTASELSKYFRDEVQREAVTLYEQERSSVTE